MINWIKRKIYLSDLKLSESIIEQINTHAERTKCGGLVYSFDRAEKTFHEARVKDLKQIIKELS